MDSPIFLCCECREGLVNVNHHAFSYQHALDDAKTQPFHAIKVLTHLSGVNK